MKSNFKVGQAVEVLRYTPAVRGTIKYICKYTAEELQRELNKISYPPTHTYNIATLEPTSTLKERCDIIDNI